MGEPGVKYDAGKPMMSLLPPRAAIETAKILTFGAKKYAPDNWKKVEDGERRYMDAALRHLFAHMMGEKFDNESGLSHLAHASCCVMFLLEKELEKNEIEQRNAGHAEVRIAHQPQSGNSSRKCDQHNQCSKQCNC